MFFLVLSFCSKCCNSVHGLHTWIFMMSLGVDVPIGCLQVLNLSRSQHGDAFNLHSFDQTPGGDRCGSKYRGKLPSLCVCLLATYVHLNNRNAAYSSNAQWMKTLKWDEGCVTPLSSSLGTDWLTMPEFFHLMADVRKVFAWLKIHSSVKWAVTGLDRKKKRCNCSVITSFKKQKTLGHTLLTTN